MDGLEPAQALPWTKSTGSLIFEVWDEPSGDARVVLSPLFFVRQRFAFSNNKSALKNSGEMLHIMVWELCMERGNQTQGTGAALLIRADVCPKITTADDAMLARAGDLASSHAQEVMDNLVVMRPRDTQTDSWRRTQEQKWHEFCMRKAASSHVALPYARPTILPDGGMRPWFVECDEVIECIRRVKERRQADLTQLRESLSEHSMTSTQVLRQVTGSFRREYQQWVKSSRVATLCITLVEALDLELPKQAPSNQYQATYQSLHHLSRMQKCW